MNGVSPHTWRASGPAARMFMDRRGDLDATDTR